MKRIISLAALAIWTSSAFSQAVGISTNNSLPDASAILDVSSTTKGFLLPRMTLDQINSIQDPAEGLMVWCSNCAVQTGELQIYNGTSWYRLLIGPTTADTLAVGDHWGGGIIFYLLKPGDTGYIPGEQHGLIASPPNNENYYFEWGCSGTDLPGASGTAIGTGNQNTLDIVASCSTAVPAHYCHDLIIGPYSDWYLPSKEEMYQMFENNEVLDFNFSWYTTSSEIDATTVWTQGIYDGQQYSESKSYTVLVRPIRSF